MNNAYLVPHPPLLIPGVGTGKQIPDTWSAYNEIANEIKKDKPDTIILISPHSILYSDYIHIAPGRTASGDFSAFGAKQVSIKAEYDIELAALIGETAEKEGIRAGHLGEREPMLDHGVMVPLHFIGTDIKIVRISLSGLSLIDHYRFGMCVRQAAKKMSRCITVVASGDMSHKLKQDGPYGFVPEGPEFDAFIRECVRDADFIRLLSIDRSFSECAAECGLRSLVILAGALDGMNVKSRELCYEGPYGVGYLTASFTADGDAPSLLPSILEAENKKLLKRRENEDEYVRLARNNIEMYIKTGKMMELPADLSEEMQKRRAGVFVSIKKDGMLRGCIGTIEATQPNIALEILKNSIDAAIHDPRFDAITEPELSSLTYSVDVLSPAEPIDSLDMLDVKRYGVIVTHGYRRGLLLPNLEGVDSVKDQVSIALQKAGIRENESYSLERFEVVRHL